MDTSAPMIVRMRAAVTSFAIAAYVLTAGGEGWALVPETFSLAEPPLEEFRGAGTQVKGPGAHVKGPGTCYKGHISPEP